MRKGTPPNRKLGLNSDRLRTDLLFTQLWLYFNTLKNKLYKEEFTIYSKGVDFGACANVIILHGLQKKGE